MERKIGEIFKHGDEWYQCLKSEGCRGCDFLNTNCIDNPNCKCDFYDRSDNCSVIFRKLEKVEGAYAHNSVIVQKYRIRATPVIMPNEPYMYFNAIDNTIAIEIKQNKEDMEEKKVKVSRENWDYLVDKLRYILSDYLHGGESDEVIAEFENLLEIDNHEEKKLNLNPFDLEKAKAGKPVCTKDGRKARIICFDRVTNSTNEYTGHLIVLVTNPNGDEQSFYYTEKGNLAGESEYDNHKWDLMMLPQKKEGWVNVYHYDNDDAYSHRGCKFIYDTKEQAVKEASSGSAYITTVKIEWEE